LERDKGQAETLGDVLKPPPSFTEKSAGNGLILTVAR
jgi:hypothetical protein